MEDDEGLIDIAPVPYMPYDPWKPISTAPKDGTPILIPGGVVVWHFGKWYSIVDLSKKLDRPIRDVPWWWQPFPEKEDSTQS